MLLRLNRITDDLRLQHVLLQDEMVYTTDTNRLFIGDGETVGGQDVATMLIDGVEAIVDSHIARGVTAIRDSNYNELRTDISVNSQELNKEVEKLKVLVQQDIENLKVIITAGIRSMEKTVSQHILTSISPEIKDSFENNNNNNPDFRLTCYKGTLDDPINTEPGDQLFGISFNVLHDASYLNAANIQAHWSPTADLTNGSGDSSLVFTVHKNNDQLQQFSFDHDGTLSAPSIKTGPYTTERRDALTPEVGTIIYNSSINKFQGYQNTNGTTFEWVNLS